MLFPTWDETTVCEYHAMTGKSALKSPFHGTANMCRFLRLSDQSSNFPKGHHFTFGDLGHDFINSFC